MSESDQELLLRMSSGDQEALSVLYDKYAAKLLRVAFNKLKNRRDAEDLIHDIFLEAWQKAASYDAGRGSVVSWLMIRVRSRAIDRIRTLQLVNRIFVSDPDGIHDSDSNQSGSVGSDNAVQYAAEHRYIYQAMHKLTETQRKVVELGYFQGFTYQEMADACGVPIGTIKSRLSAAITKLREHMATPLEASS